MISRNHFVLLALVLAMAGFITYFILPSNRLNTSELPETDSNREEIGWKEPLMINSTYTVDDLLDRLVVVTAISDNHFQESQSNLPSIHKCLPNNRVILYDLGLNEKNRAKILTTQKYVKLRRLPIDSYEHLPHVKNLFSYAWKPIIINEVAKEFDVILYADAAIRMVTCDPRKVLQYLFEFPFVGHRLTHYAIEFTADKMIEYLHYPKTRKDIANFLSYEASGMLLLVNSTLKERFLKHWLDCALHQECIAPKGTSRFGCHITENHDGHYIGCHRYDQSALSLILAREFGTRFIDNYSNRTSSLFAEVWGMHRL